MTNRLRATAALRAAVGVTMLTRPAQVARLLGAAQAGRHPVVRLLGLRHVAQAAVVAARPDASTCRASNVVDGVHVLSCLLFAAAAPAHRRPAVRDAALESGVLLVTWAACR
jgi:hypothetical protein